MSGASVILNVITTSLCVLDIQTSIPAKKLLLAVAKLKLPQIILESQKHVCATFIPSQVTLTTKVSTDRAIAQKQQSQLLTIMELFLLCIKILEGTLGTTTLDGATGTHGATR